MSRRFKKSSSYRSGFEADIAQTLRNLKVDFKYESLDIPYQIPKTYKPDFELPNGVLVEAKGFFRAGDTQKYKAIKNCLPPDKTLVFILMKPNQKVRKGTQITMADWCTKEGFLWYTIGNLEELVKLAKRGIKK